MSIFEDLDARLAQSVGRVLNSTVSWEPKRSRGRSGDYTGPGIEDDPNRVGRTIRAIVTWRTHTVEAGSNPDEGGALAFDCCVDVAVADFARAGQPGIFDLPRKPDHFVLTEEFEGNNRVQIDRDGDDGSQRMLYYCTVPST